MEKYISLVSERMKKPELEIELILQEFENCLLEELCEKNKVDLKYFFIFHKIKGFSCKTKKLLEIEVEKKLRKKQKENR